MGLFLDGTTDGRIFFIYKGLKVQVFLLARRLSNNCFFFFSLYFKCLFLIIPPPPPEKKEKKIICIKMFIYCRCSHTVGGGGDGLLRCVRLRVKTVLNV